MTSSHIPLVEKLSGAFTEFFKEAKNCWISMPLVQKLYISNSHATAPNENLFQERCEFIGQGVQNFAENNNLKDPSIYFINNGRKSIVFGLADDHVIKIRTGKPYNYSGRSEHIFHYPEDSNYSQQLNIGYEIYQKAEIDTNLSLCKELMIMLKALRHWNIITDSHIFNYGYVKDKKTGEKTLKLIDSDAMKTLPFARFFNKNRSDVATSFIKEKNKSLACHIQ